MKFLTLFTIYLWSFCILDFYCILSTTYPNLKNRKFEKILRDLQFEQNIQFNYLLNQN